MCLRTRGVFAAIAVVVFVVAGSIASAAIEAGALFGP